MTLQGANPTILIVSVNPLSRTSNNGKTIASMFRGYPKDSVAQLYFHREVPTSDVCDNYFSITDEDLLRAVRRAKAPTGRRVLATSVPERVMPEAATSLLKRSKAVRLLRSVLWTLVSLEKPPLKEWLDDVNPDVVFFCGGDSNHLYKKVLRLARRYDAKIVYYITDDYVLPARTLNPFAALNRAWTRRVFKSMCHASALILTIGDEMSSVYGERFGFESQSVMNMVAVPDAAPPTSAPTDRVMVFSYVGGLHSNRGRVLARIAASLERLAIGGLRGELRVYSADQPERSVASLLENPPFSSYRGKLDADGVAQVLRDSDVLVHVESDDSKSKTVTRLSVSTKIPEYMAAGKPILAAGPSDVASIRYLLETRSAFVAPSLAPDAIDATVSRVISDPALREAYARNAWTVARSNHDESVVRTRLQAQIVALAGASERPAPGELA